MINQTRKSPMRPMRPGREAFVAANAALLYTLPFLGKINWLGIHDWELFTAMAEIPRSSARLTASCGPSRFRRSRMARRVRGAGLFCDSVMSFIKDFSLQRQVRYVSV